jgi:putative hemolysin
MTYPGAHTSPGFPALEGVAQDAIAAARSRVDALTRPRFPLPARVLSEQEKAEALKSAADAACVMCGGVHPAPNTPACPRVASCKLNPDGRITEASFWPDGTSESAVEMDGEGNVRSVRYATQSGWPVDRVVLASDLAEESGTDAEGGSPVLRVPPELAAGKVLALPVSREWRDVLPGLQWRVSGTQQGVEFRVTPEDAGG